MKYFAVLGAIAVLLTGGSVSAQQYRSFDEVAAKLDGGGMSRRTAMNDRSCRPQRNMQKYRTVNAGMGMLGGVMGGMASSMIRRPPPPPRHAVFRPPPPRHMVFRPPPPRHMVFRPPPPRPMMPIRHR